jgi:hypothetical protein
MVTWVLAKHTCRSLHNSFTLLRLDCMPPNQIVNVSLNQFRMGVAAHHKTITMPSMNDILVYLDS